jgi:hypothetical protein
MLHHSRYELRITLPLLQITFHFEVEFGKSIDVIPIVHL